MSLLKRYADWTILTIAGLVIAVDMVLPSWLTGPLDEIALFGCVAAMKFLRK